MNLEKLNVTELSVKEAKETDGGFLFLLIGYIYLKYKVIKK
ncbi:class IIb bacteriocin, lactobin A/cerein 7B family [Flavobacterium hercynium]|nr:class IIb bacteriocin, lactobin A/cerein 7B family [Flavobacterium hercynium]